MFAPIEEKVPSIARNLFGYAYRIPESSRTEYKGTNNEKNERESTSH